MCWRARPHARAARDPWVEPFVQTEREAILDACATVSESAGHPWLLRIDSCCRPLISWSNGPDSHRSADLAAHERGGVLSIFRQVLGRALGAVLERAQVLAAELYDHDSAGLREDGPARHREHGAEHGAGAAPLACKPRLRRGPSLASLVTALRVTRSPRWPDGN